MCFFHPIPFGEWCKTCGELYTSNPVPIQKNPDVQHYGNHQPQVNMQQQAAARPRNIQQHGSVQPKANIQQQATVPEKDSLATQTPMLVTFSSYPLPPIIPLSLPRVDWSVCL